MARTAGSHSDITGPRIREAALRLFAKHGYAAVSMRRIASEVGVQAGALYNYIPDKQALLFSLLKGHMDELLEAWDETAPGGDPLARLEAFVRFHIRFTLRRPESIFISYMELRNLEPENFIQIEALRGRYEAVLEQILRDGQAAGNLSVPDTRIAAFALIGMLTGVNTWYREGGRLSEDEVAALYWDMARKAVGAG
ncbi:TetR/AcrR family transcriptional regulator [Salipiger mangrovisoli]|uniref:TetR family transcriptional regulator n=1 Tax=Salipiger mangrovisoli TaxID=2865933 RepID=A0ABR9WVE7_9RHOB|nr:TetR/AcrR family transcriptional regulator [Salipiger mangrovisoli]MBE9635245.1 TetR family transcriptional regulator [Salipiger mangrovisoli]